MAADLTTEAKRPPGTVTIAATGLWEPGITPAHAVITVNAVPAP